MERTKFDTLLTAALPAIEQAARLYAAKYGRAHEWQDIAQTSLLKMLRFAGLYDPARGELLPWACVVIINTLKSRCDQVAASPFTVEYDARAVALTAMPITPESELQVAEIWAALNIEARLYVEGYNYVEIAARRGYKSRTTVKTHIDTCAARLRRALGLTAEQGRRQKFYVKTAT